MPHRMSSLPLTQFCGQAPVIRAQRSGSADRAAIQSSYFHALCAGRTDETARLRPALTEEELTDAESWHKPATCTLDYPQGKVVLDYADAETELEVMIGADGETVADAAQAITVGHLDFAWPIAYAGRRVVFVADIKRSAWTVRNPNSLQLLAYGWAACKRWGADAFVPGIWAAQEGEWSWGDWHDLDPFDSQDLWLRIRHAALNDGPASTGPHCRNCFARLHCREFVFPKPETAAGALAVFAENGPEPTPESVADAVLWAQSIKDVAERVLDNAKEYARRGNKVLTADGREYRVSMRQGRETADIKRLKADLGEDAKKYLRRGESFPYPSWSSR